MKKILLVLLVVLLTSCSKQKSYLSIVQEIFLTDEKELVVYETYGDDINPFGTEIDFTSAYVERHISKFGDSKDNPYYEEFVSCSRGSDDMFLDIKFSQLNDLLQRIDSKKIDKPKNIPFSTSRLTINTENRWFVYFYTTHQFIEIKNDDGDSEYYNLSSDDADFIYHFIDEFYAERYWVRPCTLLLTED